MSSQTTVYLIIGLFALVLIFLLRGARREILRLRDELTAIKFSKQSQSSKYGKLSEQFMPFLKHYPYDPQAFRFLGTPIDGVQFCEDKIVFMEFKTAGAQLSPLQRQIKQMVDNGQIEWCEFALRDKV